jgi:plastocyanin
MKRTNRRVMGLATLVAALMLVTGLTIGLSARASAQGDEAAHPAHVHTGQCPTPGDVVFPLSNVGSADNVDGTPTAGGSPVGLSSAVPVDASTTTIKSALSDLVASPHAIVVHESAANIQNYLVCGDIGGTMMGASDLAIGLAAVNNSGYSGIATLHDNGDGTTTVAVFMTESGEGGASAEASPAAETGTSAGAAAVEIKSFAFNPGELDVAVGTTVTWTNDDQTAHTVSQVGGGFESGKLDPGKTFSFTFTKAGTYDYFCQFHANMKGTVVVK